MLSWYCLCQFFVVLESIWNMMRLAITALLTGRERPPESFRVFHQQIWRSVQLHLSIQTSVVSQWCFRSLKKCSLDKTFILKSPYNLLKWLTMGWGDDTHCVQAPKSTHEHIYMYIMWTYPYAYILHTYKDYKTIAEVSLVSDTSAHFMMTITLRTALSWRQNRPHNSCKAL